MKIHTVQEAAHVLRCSTDLIRSLIKRGELDAIPIGSGTKRKRYIVPADALEAFIDAKRKNARQG